MFFNFGQSNRDLDTIPVVYENHDFWPPELTSPYRSRNEEYANSDPLTRKKGKVAIGMEF